MLLRNWEIKMKIIDESMKADVSYEAQFIQGSMNIDKLVLARHYSKHLLLTVYGALIFNPKMSFSDLNLMMFYHGFSKWLAKTTLTKIRNHPRS